MFPLLTKYFFIQYSYLHFILLLLSPFLFLYFQRLHTSDNDQITYVGFTFVLKKGIITPLLFLLFCFELEKYLDNKFRDLLQKKRQFFSHLFSLHMQGLEE